jgi:hypothetical protein
MNDVGQIAGSYAASDYTYHGFFRDTNGTFTSFDMPGTRTYVNGINLGGYLVGRYGSRSGIQHGFMRRPDGTTVSLQYPGANQKTSTTDADCINQNGVIAGHYQINTTTNTVTHGFLVTGVN